MDQALLELVKNSPSLVLILYFGRIVIMMFRDSIIYHRKQNAVLTYFILSITVGLVRKFADVSIDESAMKEYNENVNDLQKAEVTQ